jgi:micrococcal nuclease
MLAVSLEWRAVSKKPSKSWRYEHVTLDRVIDGDTIDVIIDVGFRFTTRQRLRLLELDTPERGQPLWRESTAHLRRLLADHPLTVTTVKQDSFGRWLAYVAVNGQDVSTLMRDWLRSAADGV